MAVTRSWGKSRPGKTRFEQLRVASKDLVFEGLLEPRGRVEGHVVQPGVQEEEDAHHGGARHA